MRYFTMGWWCGSQGGDAGDPAADYARHPDAVRHRLPPAVLAAQEAVPFHDARLRELVVRPAAATARLVLDAYAGGGRFDLTYRGGERVESAADPDVGLPGPHGYGDLGYDELDVLPDGAFEHRLLFSSGIELAIAFRDFEWRREA